jgi:hypothetical protein
MSPAEAAIEELEPPTPGASGEPEPPTPTASGEPEPPIPAASGEPEPPIPAASGEPEPPIPAASGEPEPPIPAASGEPEPPIPAATGEPEPPIPAATGEPEPPIPAASGAPPDPVPRAMAGPLVPSVRTGPSGSEAPSSTSGSSNSADAIKSVGISPESGGASGTDVLEAGRFVEMDAAGGASEAESSSTPYASRSSSELIGSFDAGCGWDAAFDAAAAVEEEARAASPCDAVAFSPKGSSTGRSAKDSKAGREAASIVSSRTRAINPERILQCRRRGT